MMVSTTSTTHVSLYKRQATSIAVALFVFALLTLSGNASLTPVGAASNSQTPAQPTQTPTASPILLTDPVPDPKQEGVLYFPQTGHTLRGAFLDYWNRYGGLAQFGYPLTEEFFEPVGGENKMYLVQYFERNRFELHPENAGTQYEVLLGTLGRDFRQQNPPAAPIAGATYFPQTGHNLSGAFKQFWEARGGLFVNGYPITEPVMERGTDGKEHLVQWFERSRFEMHPENAGTPYEVLLGLLGRQLSEKKGYPYGWYPLYGHAPDFSWLSGRLVLYAPVYISSPEAGCAILHYKADGTRVQLGKWTGRAVDPQQSISLIEGATYVVFGQPARLEEPYRQCFSEPAPGYMLDKLQLNPSQ